jgi:hypothetical protein
MDVPVDEVDWTFLCMRSPGGGHMDVSSGRCPEGRPIGFPCVENRWFTWRWLRGMGPMGWFPGVCPLQGVLWWCFTGSAGGGPREWSPGAVTEEVPWRRPPELVGPLKEVRWTVSR